MRKDDLLKMHLQFFAEDSGSTGAEADKPQDDQGNAENANEKDTFTRAELDSQISKSVENALEKQRERLEAEKVEALRKAREEAEEYSKLTEREKLERDLEERQKELDKRENELRIGKLKSDVESDLKENGLPTVFAESLILLSDHEEIKTAVKDIKKAFDEGINEAVSKRLRQDDPEDGQFIRKRKEKPNDIADYARKSRIIQD